MAPFMRSARQRDAKYAQRPASQPSRERGTFRDGLLHDGLFVTPAPE
ncbi:hypothetical protein DB32_001859 [Sandaracinus amylolyticus]|uniref:Uncharacterized protein n=1 Tax=Sandaracinus amylolyticus TaxID=927083 RepID=A0A0F6YGH9_9BACT|nr:hypothetical protein DB32_001859 [Sandaracinus amylolyticus]